jgi:hypothetical protein
MTRHALAAVAVATLTFVQPTQAAELFGIYGEGAKGCGDYLESRKANNLTASYGFTQWTWAYVSAYNKNAPANKQVTGPLPQNSVLAFLDKHCRENPLDIVVNGVDALIVAKAR